MAKLKLFHLYLNEIQIKENGRPGPFDAQNIVTVNLIWPRARIDQRTAIKVLRLEDNRAVDFSKESLAKRILFKESVQREFAVTVEISERKSPNAIQKFLASTIGTLVSSAWPLPSTEEAALRIIRAGTLSALGNIDAKEKIQLIATGEAELDPAKNQKTKLKIPLTAPADIKDPRASGQKKRPPLLTAGASNGHIILDYEISAE